MKRVEGGYEFSTGRVIHAQMGVLGVGPDSKTIWEGGARLVDQNGLSPAEKVEMTEEMVSQWLTWAGVHEANVVACWAVTIAMETPKTREIPLPFPADDIGKAKLLEEILTRWLEWMKWPSPRALAQMTMAFGEHLKRGGRLPTAPVEPEPPPALLPDRSDVVTIGKALYEKLLADAVTLQELGGSK